MSEIKTIILRDILHFKGNKEILVIPELIIEQNSKLALVGPNGTGKSSLLEILSLIEKPSKGLVMINGAPVTRKNILTLKRKIGFLPQKPVMFKMSVFKNIALPLKFRHLPKAVIEDKATYWMHELHILHLAKQTATNLSGGEQQKVALARMLVSDPEILLLDEPLTGIDRRTKNKFTNELSRIISQNHRTVVYITHNKEEVYSVSNDFKVLDMKMLNKISC